jgi:hypothetical protein
MLRSSPTWLRVREIQRDGLGYWLARWGLERKILATRPIRTRPAVPSDIPACEVHILTYDRDCLLALWAAKSFYAQAEVDWPLVWHEGGSLKPGNRGLLRRHFPDSALLTVAEANRRVESELDRLGLSRCREARRRTFMLYKLLDCLVLSRAQNILCLDSDILFFRRPDDLLKAGDGPLPHNRYARDRASCYGIGVDAALARFGVAPVERLNAGLSLFRRASLDLAMLEEFLGDSDLVATPWLTEQTLHALCAGRIGVDFLPEEYLVSTEAELHTPDGRNLVAKHYPSHPRRYLFEEGIPHLERQGFLERLQR